MSCRSSLHLRICSPSVLGSAKTLRGFSALNRTWVKGKKATQLNGFDYEAWLLERGIGATGYVRQRGEQKRIGSRNSFFDRIEQAREAVRDRFLQHLGATPRSEERRVGKECRL